MKKLNLLLPIILLVLFTGCEKERTCYISNVVTVEYVNVKDGINHYKLCFTDQTTYHKLWICSTEYTTVCPDTIIWQGYNCVFDSRRARLTTYNIIYNYKIDTTYEVNRMYAGNFKECSDIKETTDTIYPTDTPVATK